MADYASILKRSVDALPKSDADSRTAVYERARAALSRQLASVNPPIPEADRARQMASLEEAIARVEAEESLHDAPAVPDDAMANDAAFDGGGTAEAAGGEPDTVHGAPVENELRAPRSTAAPADDRDEPAAHERHADAVAGASASAREPVDPEIAATMARAKPSRAPLVLGTFLLLVMLGGAGVLAYTQRAAVGGYYDGARNWLAAWRAGEDEVDTPVVAEAPQEQTELTTAANDAPDPEPVVRMIPVRPVRGVIGEADGRRGASGSSPRERIVDATERAEGLPEQAPLVDAAEDAADDAAEDVGGNSELDVAQMLPGAGSEAGAGAANDGAPAIAQRAVYYEQGPGGIGNATAQGRAVWSEEGAGDAASALIDLPEREASVSVSIRVNDDPDLPASHLIEMRFSDPRALGGKIKGIPAVLAKSAERAAGEPLIGVDVPVTDTVHWIALSADDSNRRRNVALIRESNWFELPILFEDGKRALLTFEKGASGARELEPVLKAGG